LFLNGRFWDYQDNFSRAGSLAKLSNWGRRALVKEVTKNPMVTLTELHRSSVEMVVILEGSPISAAIYQSGPYDSGQMEATPQ
jgi:hypothetical protein